MLPEEVFSLVFEKVHENLECRAAEPTPRKGADPIAQPKKPRTKKPAKKPTKKPSSGLPKGIRFVTFDCYGTLIDWETGAYDAYAAEAERDGFTIDRNAMIPHFIGIQKQIQRGSYELYAEVLRRTAVRSAQELKWDLEPSRSGFLPDSVPRWPPFRETNAQLERFVKKYEIGILSNIDDKLLGATRRHFRVDFDLVVTAQQVRSYKPDPAHFRECARRIGGKRGWVHIGSGYDTDVEPCLKMKVPVIWVNRRNEKLEPNQKKPTHEVKNLREAAKLLRVL